MFHFYADDGRILTPPKELEPQLKGAYSAFIKLLGHIRFFYMVDEIWDGQASLAFKAEGVQLASITFDDNSFKVRITDEDFQIVDETLLDIVYEALKKTAPSGLHRPFDQLTVNLEDPNEFPCGYRCDMCLGNKKFNEKDFSGSEKFDYMNWVCYHECVPNVTIERNVHNKSVCPGCEAKRNNCGCYTCPTEKGYANCVECGAYHSCNVYSQCHYSGQCNLGLTAEEVTNMVVPYAMKERLDVFRGKKERCCYPLVDLYEGKHYR
ncbi:hypothetical protein [Clostridium thermarum]|uniref:hypothetical protein n=1 Tax=Clostridium thermarum TaxID=1716543 RepID=UPI0013D53EA5|nr:hypothetical protein [Clostridium thermarum]